MSEKKNYGMVTEQGDLGLGFFAMNESDAHQYAEHERDRKNTEDQGDTEEDK